MVMARASGDSTNDDDRDRNAGDIGADFVECDAGNRSSTEWQ